jgi:hypothetical protein
MSTSPDTSPATDFRNASISFEDFAGVLLSPWLEDTRQLAGPAVSSPRVAAARAAYEASVVHAGKRGVVLVAASEAAGARQCLDFLRSFFEDEPRLRALLKCMRGDEIVLHGDLQILCTSAPRRPRGLLSTIRLKPNAPPEEDPLVMLQRAGARQFARALFAVARESESDAGRIEDLLGLERGWFAERRCLSEERTHSIKVLAIPRPADGLPISTDASATVSAMVIPFHPRMEIIGDKGHFMMPAGEETLDGQRWSVHLPDGQLVAYRWGKDAAERAVHQLIREGRITV